MNKKFRVNSKYKTRFYLLRSLQITGTLAVAVILALFWCKVFDTKGSDDYWFYIMFLTIIAVAVLGMFAKRAYVSYITCDYVPESKNPFFNLFFKPAIPQNKFEKVVMIIILITEVLLLGDMVLFALNINDTAGVIETVVFVVIIVVLTIALRISRFVSKND